MSPGDKWDDERAEVLKAVALLEQTVEGLRSDFGELRAGLAQTLSELKEQAADGQKRFQDLLVDYATRCVQIEAMKVEMNKLDLRVKEIEKLAPAVRVMMWVGALLGASIVALIWALITGQAQVMFK